MKTDFGSCGGILNPTTRQGKALRRGRSVKKIRPFTIISVVDNLDFIPELLAHIELGCK